MPGERYPGVEDLKAEYRIKDSAITALHGHLKTTRDQPIMKVADQLKRLIDLGCADCRRNNLTHQVYDVLRGDRNVQLHPIEVADGASRRQLIAVVIDDYDVHGREPAKTVVTVLNMRQANQSVLQGRWLTPDGLPLDGAPKPLASATEASGEDASVDKVAEPGVVVSGPVLTSTGEAMMVVDPASYAPLVSAPSPTTSAETATHRAPKGHRRGGTTEQREAFVLDILRRNPNLHVIGRDGVSDQVAARFGVGMRHSVVERLRARLKTAAPAPVPSTPPVSEFDSKLRASAQRLVAALKDMKDGEKRVATCMSEIVRLIDAP